MIKELVTSYMCMPIKGMKDLIVLAVVVSLVAATHSHMDKCVTCIEFSFNYSYSLWQLVNGGMVKDCGHLCQELLNTTHNQQSFSDCGKFCNLVGFEKFANACNTSFKNPFVFCEMITACPIMDNGDAKIWSVEVQPPVVPHGSHFKIVVTFQSHNGTGTGEATLLIFNKNSPYPVDNLTIMEPKPPGIHKVIWEYTAKLDPNCPEKCEVWSPGTYDMQINLCSGWCYGSLPHNKIYDYKEQSFQVIPAHSHPKHVMHPI